MKLILYTLTILLTLVSCGSKTPFEGEWKPKTEGTSATLFINADGVVGLDFKGNDGSFSCLGKWVADPDDPDFIYVTFYPSTINVSAANPVVREILRTGMLEICNQSLQSPFLSSISADGQNLALNGGGFYKVSSNPGLTKGLKLKDLPTFDESNTSTCDSIEYEVVKPPVSEN